MAADICRGLDTYGPPGKDMEWGLLGFVMHDGP